MKANEMKQENLDSILLDFRIEAAGVPKPTVLEAYCRKYPQYARELTDYAVHWLIGDALAATAAGQDLEQRASSPLVSRAISRFHDRIVARTASAETVARRLSGRETCYSPFEGLSVAHKREIRDMLGINMPLLAKFQNRLIDPDTVPRGFLKRFAEMLGRTLDEFVGYLRLPPVMHAQADFKAEGKPVVEARKETFECAVRGSFLSDGQKQALLKAE